MNEPKDSGYFADYQAARITAGRLQELSFLSPAERGAWSQSYVEDRIAQLQQVEDIAAQVDGRPAELVYAYEGPIDERGFYCRRNQILGKRRGIHVNVAHPLFSDPNQAVETILHEGRHSYQVDAVRTSGFHPDMPEVAVWKRNLKNYKRIGRASDEASVKAYMEQPVERDAGAVGKGVSELADLGRDQRQSQCRIACFNKRNGLAKYGSLRPHTMSLSDPARLDRRPASGTMQRTQTRTKVLTNHFRSLFGKRHQRSPEIKQRAQTEPATGRGPKVSRQSRGHSG